MCQDEVHDCAAAGRKTCRAHRKHRHPQVAGFDAPQIVIGLARGGRKATLDKRSIIALTHRGKRAMINAGDGCRSAVTRSRGFEKRRNCARSWLYQAEVYRRCG